MFTRFASRVARPAVSAWKASGGVATVAAKSAHNYRLVAGAGLAALAAAAGTLSEDNKAACSNTVFGAVRVSVALCGAVFSMESWVCS